MIAMRHEKAELEAGDCINCVIIIIIITNFVKNTRVKN